MMQTEIVGNELMVVIRRLTRLEWAKYAPRRPLLFVNGEQVQASRPDELPYTSFRMEDEESSLVSRLRAAVNLFKGNVQWDMFYHERAPLKGRNWVICPRVRIDMRSRGILTNAKLSELVEASSPGFIERAFADLPNLAVHVDRQLGERRNLSPDSDMTEAH